MRERERGKAVYASAYACSRYRFTSGTHPIELHAIHSLHYIHLKKNMSYATHLHALLAINRIVSVYAETAGWPSSYTVPTGTSHPGEKSGKLRKVGKRGGVKCKS